MGGQVLRVVSPQPFPSPTPPEVHNGDLEKLLSRRKILKLMWHLTNRCNLACSYCYVKVNRFTTDLPTEKMLEIADRINEAGVGTVQMTGGEVSLRPDLLEIVDRISRKVQIGLATNGSHITPDMARFFAERGVFVSLSIDHVIDARNVLTRKGSDTPLLLANLRILVEAGVKTGVSSVITRANFRDVAALAKHFHELGVYSWKGIVLSYLGEAKDSGMFDRSMLDYAEEEETMKTLYGLRQEYLPTGFQVKTSKGPFPAFYETFAQEKGYGSSCLCGYVKATLKHDGGLVPCDSIQYPEDYWRGGFAIPSVLEGESLNTIFQESALFQYWALATAGVVPVGCNNCSIFDSCRGACRGKSLVRAGNPAGLFGRSEECARNNKIRFEQVPIARGE